MIEHQLFVQGTVCFFQQMKVDQENDFNPDYVNLLKCLFVFIFTSWSSEGWFSQAEGFFYRSVKH